MKMDNIKIGVDGNEANVDKHVGVSVYTLNLLKYFSTIASEKLRFVIYLRKKPGKLMPPVSDYFQYLIVPGPILWSQIFLPAHLYLHRIVDVFFSPAHYTPRLCPVPIVVTIHDLSYLYYPEEFLKKDLYKLKNWTESAIYGSKKIIAVSKTTKKDILKNYNIDEAKVDVIYNGYTKTSPSSKTKNPLATFDLKKNQYILYVGTLQPRKNIPTLIKAFEKLHHKHPDFRLVIVGKKGWLFENIYQEAKKSGLEDLIIFTGYLQDDEVVMLYQNAFVYVLPSFYEGFGIPLLEAMSNNCPVIASYSSSLPEIAGEAGLYFDPKSHEALHEKIENLLVDNTAREMLIKKGVERSRLFSWDECGKNTLKSILSAVSDNAGND